MDNGHRILAVSPARDHQARRRPAVHAERDPLIDMHVTPRTLGSPIPQPQPGETGWTAGGNAGRAGGRRGLRLSGTAPGLRGRALQQCTQRRSPGCVIERVIATKALGDIKRAVALVEQSLHKRMGLAA